MYKDAPGFPSVVASKVGLTPSRTEIVTVRPEPKLLPTISCTKCHNKEDKGFSFDPSTLANRVFRG